MKITEMTIVQELEAVEDTRMIKKKSDRIAADS
jgi:hypothetical protein